MANSQPSDTWDAGDPYERYMGRWSRALATRFLEWLNLPPALTWLDVGCGTGALTEAIVHHAQPRQVIGLEPSEGFLNLARKRLSGRAELHQADAFALPIANRSVDVIVSGLVLNFVPQPLEALRHLIEKLKRGGTLAAYVWDYAAGMEMIRTFWDAAVQLDPSARDLDEAQRFLLCQPTALETLFQAVALEDIELEGISLQTTFADFDEYWQPFLGGQGPAPSYVSNLSQAARQNLREHLRQRLATQADSSIQLTARAWAIRGRLGP